MPLNTIQTYLQGVLDQTPLPLDLGFLSAFITPPNPNDDPIAAAYVWGSRGDEARLTVPRAQHGDLSTGGDKQDTHHPDIWLVWFGPSEDPNVNLMFPAILDTTMAVLRNVPLVDGGQYVLDPITGQRSQLLDVGERMSWQFGPVRATADQRFLRFDAVINMTITEIFQA